jgi:tripartite-type tricarboxylate transporter receptor subunit TctC
MVLRLQCLVASLLICGAAAAQQFPSRPVHFIVTTAAGGTSDITARLVGRHLEKRLGQPVIVENRTGASGTIAGNYVKSAAPDGYNLLVGGMGMSSTFVRNNAVNPEKDLLPVSNLQNGAFFLFVRSSLPVRSLGELIAWSKANPGKLNYGASSSLTTLAAEALKLKTGVTFAVIPYKGAAPIVPAMLSGDADFTIDSLPTFQPHIQADKVRVLIVTSAKRSAMLPGVPSAAESGLGDFESGFYLGLWAPLGTPRDAVQKLSAETAAVMKIPEVVEHLRSIGTEAVGSTPEELLRTHLALNRVLDEAARASNFQPQ